MNRTLFIHQLDQLHAALGSGQDILPKIRAQGFTRIAIKAWDGADWMGEFDTDTYKLTNFDTLRVWQAACNANGLALDVWANVTPAWQGALNLYQSYCAWFPGRLILDLEPYDGFFGDIDPSPFLAALRQALSGPTADAYHVPRVWITYDPRREPGWLGSNLGGWGGHMPQVYGEDGITPSMVPVVGRPVEPLLSVDDSAANWTAILRDPVLGNEDGRAGFGVFKAPVSGDAHIAVVRGLA